MEGPLCNKDLFNLKTEVENCFERENNGNKTLSEVRVVPPDVHRPHNQLCKYRYLAFIIAIIISSNGDSR